MDWIFFGAFITAEIDEPVYVQLPKGLDPDDPDHQPIWRLTNAIWPQSGAKGILRSAYIVSLVQELQSLSQRPVFILQEYASGRAHLLLHSCRRLRHRCDAPASDQRAM